MSVKIGLLPLYLKLYDDAAPEARSKVEAFYHEIAEVLSRKGAEVVTSPVCRLQNEFARALDDFSVQSVDAVVTIHLAYSPSLEVIEPLLECNLPIVVLDTTPDYDFGPHQNAAKISFNHGIHGAQDMCSMLVRNQREFFIEAGHWEHSDVLDRVLGRVRAISAARSLKGMKIGLIGDPFAGMGDFQVSPEVLEQEIGVKIIPFSDQQTPSPDVLSALQQDIESSGSLEDVPEESLKANLQITEHIMSWMNSEGLSGFTCNFLQVTRDLQVNRVPFLAASYGMYKGFGYAGEGDVLTAAMVSALLKINPRTSFAEMFCPDWAGNQIFLSHMGEVNPRVCDPFRYTMKDYRYSDADEPVYAVGQFVGGGASVVNLVPLAGGKFRLIIAPVTVHSYPDSSFTRSVHGWVRPAEGSIAEFLQRYSMLGGTHHKAVVYNEDVEVLRTFGMTAGWDVQVIR